MSSPVSPTSDEFDDAVADFKLRFGANETGLFEKPTSPKSLTAAEHGPESPKFSISDLDGDLENLFGPTSPTQVPLPPSLPSSAASSPMPSRPGSPTPLHPETTSSSVSSSPTSDSPKGTTASSSWPLTSSSPTSTRPASPIKRPSTQLSAEGSILFPEMDIPVPNRIYPAPAPLNEIIAQIEEVAKVVPLTNFGKQMAYLIADRRYKEIRAKANAEFEMGMAKVRSDLERLNVHKKAISNGTSKLENIDDDLLYLNGIVGNAEKFLNDRYNQRRSELNRSLLAVANRGMARLTPKMMVAVANYIDHLAHEPIVESD